MDKAPNVMSGNGLPNISDSGDLILGHASLPYRHSILWMTRQTYEPGQGSLCAISGASTVQSLVAGVALSTATTTTGVGTVTTYMAAGAALNGIWNLNT